VYHNITPSEFFTHDPYLARLSELGRSQLHALRRSVIASFADSEFNAFELETVGFPRGEILPLLDLTGHEKATRARLEAKAKQLGPLLFVGRIAPHKNQALLLKTYFYLKRAKRNVPKLVLVGGGDPLYREYLRLLAKTLKIEDDVELVGKISNEDLARRYAQAGVFVCVSRHEGFCIPLVEAMRARIPIVARPLTGVKETLGPAGLSLGTDRPHRIAEILLGVLESREIRLAMLEGQEAQLERLVRGQRRERAQTLLLELLDRVAPKSPHAPKETHVRPNAEPQLSL
jgi:glycosyltransferase involved in cell wall biosynthesis